MSAARKLLAFCTALLSLALLAAPAPRAGAARPPNIVFVLADDLGYGALGCYGQQKIRTPNLDRLAGAGMRFTTAYAGSNVCAPSRSTLMTGLHTGHTPVRANGKKRYLHTDDVTVAEVLKKAGYATGGFGKWGLGTEDTPGVATRQGFDEWFGQYHQVHAHFFYPFWVWQNETRYPLPANDGGKRGRYVHDQVHAKALDFIRRNKERPFFAYLPYTLPHVELVVPGDSEEPYRGRFPKQAIPDPRPGYIGSEDGYVTYAGMVSRLDRHVGEITALLQELRIADDTVVVFSSDNGPQGGPWDPLVEFFDGNGPLRGSKGQFYEGGIRVPMIVRWPGKVKAGSTDHPCAFWDVMPTLAEIAGAAAPSGIDGISFLSTLTGRGRQRVHEYLYWEYPYANRLEQACRAGNWKAVRFRPNDPLVLYDLKADPGETTDVAARHPEVAERIRRILTEAHIPERDYPEEASPPTIRDYVR